MKIHAIAKFEIQLILYLEEMLQFKKNVLEKDKNLY